MNAPIIKVTGWRLPLVAAATIALLFGGASMAAAGTSYAKFNVNAPIGQLPNYSIPSQTKATTNAAGQIRFSAIGSTCKMDATQCVTAGCGVGKKIYGIPDDNVARKLPNTIRAGTKSTIVQLRVASWNVVAVNAVGTWRSN